MKTSHLQEWLSLLNVIARGTFTKASIRTLQQLSAYTENYVLNLRGIGKTTITVQKE